MELQSGEGLQEVCLLLSSTDGRQQILVDDSVIYESVYSGSLQDVRRLKLMAVVVILLSWRQLQVTILLTLHHFSQDSQTCV